MAITITIKGVDVTDFTDFQSVAIVDTMEVTGDTMSFTLYMTASNIFGLPVILACGNEVILTDDVTKEFAGTITSISRNLGEGNQTVSYNCTATDYSYMLNRRYVNGIFSAKAITDGSADSMVKDILEHLKNAALSDTAGGDYYYNTFVANMSTPYLMANGPQVKNQIYQRVLPAQVFSDLAENTGMIWWIDFDKRVNFRSTTEMPATFLPVVAGGRGIYVEEDVTNFSNLSVDDSADGVGTKAIIKDAVIQSTSATEDQFKINDLQAVSVAGGGKGAKLALTRKPFSERSITRVINLTTGAVYVQKLEDIAREANDLSPSVNADDPSKFDCFIYVGHQGRTGGSYVRILPDSYSLNDEIEVEYQYVTNDEHENIDIDQVEVQAEATGGDGFHEFVFTKKSEIAVTDVTDLDIVADILLARKSKVLRKGSFSSLTKGWQAGQIFKLKWDRESIEEDVWVIVLNKTILTPANDPSLNDNIIQTEVQFSNIPRGLRL